MTFPFTDASVRVSRTEIALFYDIDYFSQKRKLFSEIS